MGILHKTWLKGNTSMGWYYAKMLKALCTQQCGSIPVCFDILMSILNKLLVQMLSVYYKKLQNL